MRATCVITSIFPPTSSVASFALSPAFDQVIVVGDLKSPEDYDLPGTRFIPVNEQRTLAWRSLAALPFNHYCRKMIGYLEAARSGAAIIFDTDDDNCLIEGQAGDIWSLACESELGPQIAGQAYVNVYRHFSTHAIWPRGLPLDLIKSAQSTVPPVRARGDAAAIGVWQGLANGDPDVDAIYRLVYNEPCIFEAKQPVVLAAGLCCPFNSQNTAFRRELLPLMFLPAFVSFRYTDILRGLVAQPVMWAADFRLAFTAATVFQHRNAHDYLKDFQSEVPMYITGRQAFEIALETASPSRSIAGNLRAVYAALARRQIVDGREIDLLEHWLEDCETALSGHSTSMSRCP